MSEKKPVSVTVVEAKEKPWYQRLKDRFSSKPHTTLKESKRFSRLGYLQYPKRQQLDMRLFQLMEILEDIERDFKEIADKKLSGEEIEPYAYRNIRKLFHAFLTIASPWFRGLDNRELADKASKFFRLENMIGHLPSFYPDLKRCTETLIHLGWQAMDVVAETPVLFETKTIVQPQPWASPVNPNPSHIKREQE